MRFNSYHMCGFGVDVLVGWLESMNVTFTLLASSFSEVELLYFGSICLIVAALPSDQNARFTEAGPGHNDSLLFFFFFQ